MQAGLPLVASAVGELPASLRDGETGLVVPPGDPEALAQALVWLLAHPERLAPIGAAARARVLRRFGAESFAQAGEAVFQRLPRTPQRSGGRKAQASRNRQTSPMNSSSWS
jgi:glycosyltransferase involved in cell wall biosynthesis